MGQGIRALSVEGSVSRTIVGRLLPGTDMLNGIKAVNDIRLNMDLSVMPSAL